MDIGIPLRELGAVEMQSLRGLALDQDEDAWFEQKHRQEAYDVHKDTRSIVLVFCDQEWPNLTVFKEPGWDRLASAAVPLMHDIIARKYREGGTIIRAMVAGLKSGGKIMPHTDHLPSFHAAHRIHIPLTTNTGVRFMIDGRPYKFEIGQAYEINNQLPHSVVNAGREERLTFIFDYIPAAGISRS